MVHTVFKVAKALAPSVVWIDDVDSVFKSGKVKGATGEPPNRISKHLTAVRHAEEGSNPPRTLLAPPSHLRRTFLAPSQR